MKKFSLFIILLFLPLSCAHIGTVRPLIEDESFQKENAPYRDLQILVINERGWSEASVRRCISNASAHLTAQAGIRLQIKEYHEGRIPSFTQSQAMESIWSLAADHEQFDLVLGLSPRSPVSHVVELATGYAWMGVIDDTYRKFLVLKVLDEAVLIHEICHAFVFSRAHSATGVLTGFIVKIPLVPILLNLPKYLSKRDRHEVLRNKWRDFNVRPEISEVAKTDPLPIEKRKDSNPSSGKEFRMKSLLPNTIPSFNDGNGGFMPE